MPWAARSPCTWPGCGILTDGGRCAVHRVVERAELERRRGSASSRGYDSRWRKARKLFLQVHPLCATCRSRGVIRQATVVDHIRPHKGDQALFRDERNLQALCKECHDSKTARQDGRWGPSEQHLKNGTGYPCKQSGSGSTT